MPRCATSVLSFTLFTIIGIAFNHDPLKGASANSIIKLVNGSQAKAGRLVLNYNNTWGTICDEGWDIKDAHVICRMLGFHHAVDAKSAAFFGEGAGPVWLSNLQCSGNESNISECSHNGWGQQECGHNRDVGVACTEYSMTQYVRLVDGQHSAEGRVEMYNPNTGLYGAIRASGWDLNDAQVICRMLGYPYAIYARSGSEIYGSGSWYSVAYSFGCSGTENDIYDCTFQDYYSSTSSTAAAICSAYPLSISVRLANGSHPAEGRVEVYFNNTWGTVCDEGWDIRDANAVCRMLGYSYAVRARSSAYFGEGNGPVWMENVNCDGSERNLAYCSHRGIGVSHCGHDRDAAVVCYNSYYNGLSNVTVRLAGGSHSSEGRVEVYFAGEWGTVCDRGWDINDAKVVCNMLGYSSALRASSDVFGEGRGPIWLTYVGCSGTESNIASCYRSSRYGWGQSQYCTGGHAKDAGVVCLIPSLKTRLVGGRRPSEGRVEVLINSTWGTVCDYKWDMLDANAVCKMLGYYGALNATNAAYFGEGIGPVWLYNIQCGVTDDNLINCVQNSYLTRILPSYCSRGHSQDAGVVCSEVPIDVKVRLTGGTAPAEGRVEVYYNNIWGTVCPFNEWDIRDAHVICKMLGYLYAVETQSSYFYGVSNSSKVRWLNNIQCNGQETSITECIHDGWFEHSCEYNQDIGVKCFDPYTSKNNILVRLVDGSHLAEGRVELNVNGEWGTITDRYWDIRDANVICRMLGYEFALQAGKASSLGFESGRGPFWFGFLNCLGAEKSIADCDTYITSLYAQYYYFSHSHDAGVVCYADKIKARLVGGIQPNEGRVELYYNSAWGSVCSYSWEWNIRDANAVCRMLGYSFATRTWGPGQFGEGNGTSIYRPHCSGTEVSISECTNSGWGITCSSSLHRDFGVECTNHIVSVRLINNDDSSSNEGRVEVYFNNAWGTVCDEGWDIRDANVVCRMLGYSFAMQYRTSAYYGAGSGPVWMTGLSCTGRENNIANCYHEGFTTSSHCSHSNDVGVVCLGHTLTVRLSGGTQPNEGRVEVYFNNTWGTICDNSWDIYDANTVCRTLGYSYALLARRSSYYGEGSGPIWLDNVQCTGRENSIGECYHSGWGVYSSACNHSRDAGVVCLRKEFKDSVIKLINSTYHASGRVAVYYNNTWGTICDEGWDIKDAHVICRMLGFHHAVDAKSAAFFGEGAGPVWLSNLQCLGSESNISECSHSGLGQQECGHNRDVGVACTEYVRLVDGQHSAEGRVEMYNPNTGLYGAIYSSGWDLSDAQVICKMLGYPYAIYARSGSGIYGSGSWYSVAYSFGCSGTENDIYDCTFQDYYSSTSSTAAAICSAYPLSISVRLANGSHPAEGRVEIYFNNTWGTVCDEGWDIRDANAVCRMLGYSYAVRARSSAYFGEGNGPIWMENVNCDGSERNLAYCSHRGIGVSHCGHDRDAAVVCYNSYYNGLSNVTVRLAGGSHSGEGRVEVYFAGEWGTVCDHGWDINDAKVVCNMLGHSSALRASSDVFGEGRGPIWLTYVGCSGTESNIASCYRSSRYGWGQSQYCTGGHAKDAGVVCSIHSLKTRLIGGRRPSEGRVEVLINSTWGTVCDHGWDMLDANAVCKMLGYYGALNATNAAYFGEGIGPVWLYNIQCGVTDDNLIDCVQNSYLTRILPSYCSRGHSQDAGVVCSEVPIDVKVRLAGGTAPAEGRVEVYYNNTWGTVCPFNKWDIRDAHVICKMLGYLYAVETQSSYFYGVSNSSKVRWLNSIQCNGQETSITECIHGGWFEHTCQYNQDIGVKCFDPYTSKNNILVRLVDGSHLAEGRVELNVNGEWGTIIDRSWDIRDATVICRMLGYEFALQAGKASSLGFESGRGPFWFGFLNCLGAEKSIADCKTYITSLYAQYYYFSHYYDAGVVCYADEIKARLVGGIQPNEGRVELYYSNTWGSVCGEMSDWDIRDSNVVCRMLGYSFAIKAWGPGQFGGGNGNTSLYKPYCSGTESSIAECYNSGWSTLCGSSLYHDFGVECTNQSISVRLINNVGVPSHEGRVEVYYNNTWGTVCDEGWDIRDANVVCRMLGYSFAMQYRTSAYYGAGSGPVWMSGLSCTGRESNLTDCNHVGFTTSSHCSHIFDAGVMCSSSSLTVRLSGGTHPNEGKVEIYFNDVWGTICDNSWDIYDANAVCRTLGYSHALLARQSSYYGEGSGPIWLDNVQCTGRENSIGECYHSVWGVHSSYCNHKRDAGVVCLDARQIPKLIFRWTVTCNKPSLYVQWVQPLTESEIIHYEIQYRVFGSDDWLNLDHKINSTFTTITNLLEDTKYEVRIRPVTAIDNEGWTPTMRSSYVTSVSQVTISLNSPAQASSSAYQCIAVPVAGTLPSTSVFGNQLNFVYYGQSSNVNYNVTCTISRDKSGSCGSSSKNISIYKAPKEVLKLTVRRTVITHQPALSISWTVPQSDSPIKYYDLEYKSVNQSGWDYQATTISSIKLVNLQPGVLYNIRVRAVSALGNGIWSKVFQETTFSKLDAPPPENVTVSAKTKEVILLTWMQPVAPDGLVLKGYIVEYIALSTYLPQTVEIRNASITMASISGIKLGIVYKFRIATTSELGNGLYCCDAPKKEVTIFIPKDSEEPYLSPSVDVQPNVTSVREFSPTPKPAEPTCPNSFIFKSVPSGVTVSLRCFTLSSYLHGGSVMAKCGANGIWERMDISQCTFRNTTVDYIFILGNTENTIANPMDTQLKVKNGTSYRAYIFENETQMVPQSWMYTKTKNLQESLLLLEKKYACNCCDMDDINLSVAFNLTKSLCVGSFGAPTACSCNSEKNLCSYRYLLEENGCTIDEDTDKIPDANDDCIGCCEAHRVTANLTWPRTSYGYVATVKCSSIHRNFSDSLATRRCSAAGHWESVDISLCTFANSTDQKRIIVVYLNTQDKYPNTPLTKAISEAKKYYETRVSTLLTSSTNATEMFDNFTVEVVTLDSTTLAVVILLQEVASFKTKDILLDNTSYAFIAANECSCDNTRNVGSTTQLCIADGRSCDCSAILGCECVPPFITNVEKTCERDSDFDGIPDSKDKCPYVPGSLCFDSNIQVCPTERDSDWNLQWPSIGVGEIAQVLCPVRLGNTALDVASRICQSDGTWDEDINVANCESVEFRDLIVKIKQLIATLKSRNETDEPLAEIAREDVKIISTQLSYIIQVQNKTIFPKDLETTIAILEDISWLSLKNDLIVPESIVAKDTVENLATIISNVLSKENKPAFLATARKANKENQSAPSIRLLQTIEKIANVVVKALSSDEVEIQLIKPNLGLSGSKLNLKHPRKSAVLFPGNADFAEFKNQKYIPKLKIPWSYVKTLQDSKNEKDTIKIVSFTINHMEEYLPVLPSENEKGKFLEVVEIMPASLIISSQITGFRNPTAPEEFEEKVEIDFVVKDNIYTLGVPDGKKLQFSCAYWDFEANKGAGGWSTDGITLTKEIINEINNSTHITCESIHLTSFVVLVQVVDSNPVTFDVMIYIGCGISLFWLMLSIFFFISLRKELFNKVHNFVHFNMCLALSCGLIVFLAGIRTAIGLPEACKVVTGLLHYFSLCVFTWSLCESVQIYNLLVKKTEANKRKWIYSYLSIGWGLPLSIVIITALYRHEFYFRRVDWNKESPLYENTLVCWLPPYLGLIWAFLAPMIIIVIISAILLILSLASLFKSKSVPGETKSNSIETGKQLLKTLSIMLPLFCFTWVIGLFAVTPGAKLFVILFIVSTSLQGFFIFVLYVVRHDKVWNKLKAYLLCCNKAKKMSTAFSSDIKPAAGHGKSNLYDNITRPLSLLGEAESLRENDYASITGEEWEMKGNGDEQKSPETEVTEVKTAI